MGKKKVLLNILAVGFFIAMTTFIILDIGVINKIVIEKRPSFMIEIPRNSTLKQIVGILQENKIEISSFEFKFTTKWYDLDSKLRYGRFYILENGSFTLKELATFLTRKGILTKNITIPEGLRIREIASILKERMNIDSTTFVELTKNKDLLKEFKIDADNFEGYLFPETYNFNENDKAEEIIRRMVRSTLNKLDSISKEISDSKMSIREILTLASIIQGEVMDTSEVYHISAVYNNRLKIGMLLQADPTVQYILNKPTRLRERHIKIDNPYNTYKYKGLPPGPINNPTFACIEAAVKPSDKPYLYMVARGDGGHYFNSTLNGHINDKKKFDKYRREIWRKNR
ncbi:MAG: endolytic transglycosylase MltG [Candidatus Delongbacteria bacterium]|nr:endolytic transglycosylase MltG [Candidatus Delongbacteria bacterium]